MTNQASEDRLIIAIETLVDVSLDLGKQSKMMTLAGVHTPQAIPDNEKLNMALQPYKDKVLHIIRTEKLKLLDEAIHQSTVNLKSARAVAGWAELRKEQLEAEL